MDSDQIRQFTARTLHKLDMGYEGFTEEQIKEQGLHDPWVVVRDSYYQEATDLLAIIEPHLRAKHRAELIDSLDREVAAIEVLFSQHPDIDWMETRQQQDKLRIAADVLRERHQEDEDANED